MTWRLFNCTMMILIFLDSYNSRFVYNGDCCNWLTSLIFIFIFNSIINSIISITSIHSLYSPCSSPSPSLPSSALPSLLFPLRRSARPTSLALVSTPALSAVLPMSSELLTWTVATVSQRYNGSKDLTDKYSPYCPYRCHWFQCRLLRHWPASSLLCSPYCKLNLTISVNTTNILPSLTRASFATPPPVSRTKKLWLNYSTTANTI